MKAKKTTRKTAMTDAEIKEAIRRDKEWMDNLDPEDEVEIPEGGIKGLFGDDDDDVDTSGVGGMLGALVGGIGGIVIGGILGTALFDD